MKSVEERIKEYEESIEKTTMFKKLEKMIDEEIGKGNPEVYINAKKFTEDQLSLFLGILEVYKRKGFKTSYSGEYTVLKIF